jgi:hypothetical protein
MRRLAPALLAFAPGAALACPFCDVGGEDTAMFIVSFIGFMALGMGAIFLAVRRARPSAGGAKPEDQVLEAEGVKPRTGGKTHG